MERAFPSLGEILGIWLDVWWQMPKVGWPLLALLVVAAVLKGILQRATAE